MTTSIDWRVLFQSGAFTRQQVELLRNALQSYSESVDSLTAPSYLTLGTDATLTAERVLTEGTGINLVDAGAGSTLTISADLGDFDTDDLAEGVANLYFTTERAQDAVGNAFNTTLVYDDAGNGFGRAAITGDVEIPAGSNTAAIGAGVIVNADINASAAIAMSKLAALTASRALVSDVSGVVSVSSVTSTELGYVSGVTSALQTQIDGKQPLDTTLTALAGANWAANSIPVGTGADTLAQTALAANQFLARSSAGNVEAKAITDDALLLLADADVPRLGTANTWSAANTYTGALTKTGAGSTAVISVESTTNAGGQFSAKNTLAEYVFGVSGAATGQFLIYDNTNTDSMATYSLAAGWSFLVGDVSKLAVTSTGINSTNIGATTPGTGAFTTLSATGNVTLGDASGDTLTINGTAVACSNGLNFDSNTFVIDATNNRAGFGTASPDTILHASGSTGQAIRIENTNTAITGSDSYGRVEWEGNDASATANGIRGSIELLSGGSAGEAAMVFRTAAANAAQVEAMRIDPLGGVITQLAEYKAGDITPTQLSGNTNDWGPGGLSGAAIIRASTSASWNLTGLQGGADGREILLINVGAQNLVLVHDATSTAANRFLCPNSANLTLNPNDSAQLWYDSTSSRWRVTGV